MNTECERLVTAYLSWLKTKYSVKNIDGICEITTPFLDRHNDRLQIYVEQKNGALRLTDDGYVIGDLEMSGCALDTPNRKQMFETVLRGFGVREQNGELMIDATPETFAQKKHALLQAMIAVNDMFMTARQRVARLFIEDVTSFLEKLEVRFIPNVEFRGKSGYVHRFDFAIPKSAKMPERLLRAINTPTRDNATAFIFAWTDTKEVRSPDAIAYAVLNDQEREPTPDVLGAFQEYAIRPILWSQRASHELELAA
jgi:hypothetical protein